jgi:hypothetical protein
VSLRAEIESLRQDLRRIAGKPERKLARRYGRLPPLERVSAYRRLRMTIGRLLRRLRLRPASPPEPWLPDLRHGDRGHEGRPLVIWAVGIERDTLRAACRGLETLQTALPDFSPVLVTDVADFAFFSRLGWLVEYVPSMAAPAGGFAERKRRYLAWRYRDAPALPVSAGLEEGVPIEELLLD